MDDGRPVAFASAPPPSSVPPFLFNSLQLVCIPSRITITSQFAQPRLGVDRHSTRVSAQFARRSEAMPRPTLRVQAAAGARRTFPAAKALAFREQAHLLTHNDLVLFLRPGDFAAHEWRTIRQQIAAVPPPPPPSPPASEEGSIPTAAAEGNNQLRLTYLRPGLMPAIVRTLQQQRTEGTTTVPDTSLLADASHSSGPLAALTAPTLHPPTLLRVLHLLQTFSRTPPPNAPPPPPPGKDAGPPAMVERLKLLSSLLDQTTAADPDQTTKIANLPPIEVLHAQIVGLLSAPGARITGVVSARASELARTLEGFKLGLEETAAAPSSSESPSA